MSGKKDVSNLFNKQAKDYRKGRPGYPQDLFDYIRQRAVSHDHVLDCATGSGQAVPELSKIFRRVSAFDISKNQLGHALQDSNITYFQSSAEKIAIGDRCVDAVTVAEAVHWFDRDKFYSEVNRVMKPGGLIAIWCYYLPKISDEIDALVDHYYHDILQPYAAPQREIIKDGYKGIDFPFEDEERRIFKTKKEMTFDTFIANLRSSSIVQTFKKEKGYDPLAGLMEKLSAAWGDAEIRTATWDIYCISGFKKQNSMLLKPDKSPNP